MKCILCAFEKSQLFCTVGNLNYWRCKTCDLLFLEPSQRLSASSEKARYEKHENNVLDQGYQNFVKPLFDTILFNQFSSQLGLDYGSGPGPSDSAIAYLLKQEKFQINKYDPIFCDDKRVLVPGAYDYIIACEVVEHFYEPGLEFLKIVSYLKPNGQLYVKTSLWSQSINFASWSYRRDSTHVCFYSKMTCEYIKEKFQFKDLEITDNQVMIFKN